MKGGCLGELGFELLAAPPPASAEALLLLKVSQKAHPYSSFPTHLNSANQDCDLIVQPETQSLLWAPKNPLGPWVTATETTAVSLVWGLRLWLL